MKKKFSLNAMLHNKKAMMVFSLFAALFVWASVAYGPSGTITRTVTDVPINVVLPAYAQNENLRMVDSQSFTANVTVSGPRSKVGKLGKDDISLTADTTQVVVSGAYTLDVSAKLPSTDIKLVEYTKKSVDVQVDKWVTKSFKVEADISAVKVADDKKYRKGAPLLESEGFVDGGVVLEGPSAQMNAVAQITARVTEAGDPISDVKVFAASLKALDESGKDVDISNCTYIDDTDGTKPVSVTVPVEVYQKITFEAALQNAPDTYKSKRNFVSFKPAFIEFWGSPASVEAFVEQLGGINKFDFDNLSVADKTRTVSLDPPDGVTVLGDVKQVVATLAMGTVTTKNMSMALSDSNVTILNKPANRSVSINQSQLTGILLCGPSATLKRITEKDLQVTVDMAGNATTGTGRFEARVTVKKRNNVWAYYGNGAKNGIDIWLTIDVV